MLHTARNAWYTSVWTTAARPYCGCSMPTPIIVMITAARTEMNDAMDMLDTCFSVRGRQATNEMTKPTTPNTIEQVPWSVMVFIATVNVRM